MLSIEYRARPSSAEDSLGLPSDDEVEAAPARAVPTQSAYVTSSMRTQTSRQGHCTAIAQPLVKPQVDIVQNVFYLSTIILLHESVGFGNRQHQAYAYLLASNFVICI